MCFSSVWYVIPLYCYVGLTCQLVLFFTMKSKKQPALACHFDNIGASARPIPIMVAFSGFYESHDPLPSSYARGIVPPHRDGHRNGHQSGYMLHRCFICCHPGGRWGDTEQVVARWWRPVASGVALDMLHWAMPHVLLQCLHMAIEMSSDGGTFVWSRHLFRLA
jgi:hypothetical protein